MKNASLRPLVVRSLLVLMASSLLALAACTQEAESPPATQAPAVAVSGKQTYAAYCASCHGPEGKGDGPEAPTLTTPPADLTQLRANHEGIFPEEYLYRMIDGREEVLAHGPRDMPVWGNAWRTIDGVPQSEEAVHRRIELLIEYLRTIQADSTRTDTAGA